MTLKGIEGNELAEVGDSSSMGESNLFDSFEVESGGFHVKMGKLKVKNIAFNYKGTSSLRLKSISKKI